MCLRVSRIENTANIEYYCNIFPIRTILEKVISSDLFFQSSIIILHFRLCKTHHDDASKFVQLLVLSSPITSSTNRQYITVDDWDYLIQDIIDTHPGLKFLREAREFHSRYIKTVIARVYYNCNRSWSGKLTVQELRRTNFLSVE